MKKILLMVLTALFLASLSFAGPLQEAHKRVVAAGSTPAADGSSYDVHLTFENETNDSLLSALPTDWGDDDTTDPPEGSEALITSDTAGRVYAATTESGNYYAVFKVDNTDVEISNGDAIQLIYSDSTGTTDICALRLYYNAADDTWYRAYLAHSDSASTTTIDFGENDLDASEVCVGKLEYEAGSGSNGRVQVFFTSLTDYNSNGWSNAFTAEVTDSTDTEDVGRINFLSNIAAGNGIIIDDVRGDTTDNVDY